MAGVARGRTADRAPLAVAALLVLVALVLRWWAERGIVAPWYLDEFRYAEAARQISGDWSTLVRGFGTYFYLYPRLISPAWAAASMGTTYAAAKVINVVLITSAAIPLFLWARRVLPPWRAVLALALVLALPTGLYAGALVTENGFFPAFMLASFALAWMLEAPALLRQLLALGAIALACAVRPQGIVFLLIVPSAIVLKATFDARAAGEPLSWRRLLGTFRPYLLLLGLLALAVVVYLLRQLLLGQGLSSGFGLYSFVLRVGDYSVPDALEWIVYHFGGIAIAVGFLPFIALVLLLAEAWRPRAVVSSAERALVAVAVSGTFWLVVQTGIFVSRWSERMSERYQFHAEALLLLALVVWVNRRAPRPRVSLALAVGATIALVLALPFERLSSDPSILSEAFSFVALHRLAGHVGGAHEVWLLLLGAAVAAGVFVTAASTRLLVAVAPALVLAYLIASSLAVVDPLRSYSQAVLGGAQIVDKTWIDRTVGRRPRVDLVFAGDPEPQRVEMTILQTQFWNRSVREVDRLAPIVLCCTPSRRGSVALASGVVRAPGEPRGQAAYAISVPGLAKLDGAPAASGNGLKLVRATQPLRLTSSTAGVYGDGWIGTSATYDRFARSASVRVGVSRTAWTGPDRPAHVQITVGELVRRRGGPAMGRVTARRRWTVHSTKSRTFVLPAPHRPYRVAVHIAPPFSPSQFGFGDVRQLGAQVTFGVGR